MARQNLMILNGLARSNAWCGIGLDFGFTLAFFFSRFIDSLCVRSILLYSFKILLFEIVVYLFKKLDLDIFLNKKIDRISALNIQVKIIVIYWKSSL